MAPSGPTRAAGRGEWVLLAVAGVVLGLVTQLHLVVRPVHPGFDPSYIYGYNYAADRGLVWGREFASTYGPFGYLIQGMDVGDRPERHLVALILRCVAAGLLAAVYALSSPGLGRAGRAAVLLVLLAALALQILEYAWLAPFLLLLLAGQHRGGRAGLLLAVAASLVAGFYLLMKWTLGFGAAAAVLVGCVMARDARRGRFAALGLGVPVGFLAGWLAQGQPIDAIPAHVRTGLEFTRGYSAAMSLAPPDWRIGVAAFGIWAVLTTAWVWTRRSRRNLVTLAVAAPLVFVAWKHGMVRQDGHTYVLALFGMFLVTVLLADTLEQRHRLADVLTAGLLVVPLLFVPCNQYTGRACGLPWVGSRLAQLPGQTALRDAWSFDAYRTRVARATEAALSPKRLPPALRSRLGDAPADVYPWETSYLVANGIPWRSRPVPGSFASYTRRLDHLNARFFESARRPRHLLWHTDEGPYSIDGRHVLWDEPRTARTLLSTYEVLAGDERLLVLSPRSTPRFGAPTPVGSTRATWGAWIDVPPPRGVLLMKAVLPPSWRVALIRAAFRDAPIIVTVRSETGERSYRALPESLAQGIWLSPLPGTPAELRALLASGTGPRVTAVRLDGNSMAGGRRAARIEWLELPRAGDGRAAGGSVQDGPRS